MTFYSDNFTTTSLSQRQRLLYFALLWVVTFVLYLPAAKAGWVIDSSGWLYNIRHLKFWAYINCEQSRIPSLYQFTQFVTWVCYKLFNANPYAWHTLMVTLHAVNASLLFGISRRLFGDTGIRNSNNIALAGVLLYTICPHISEVIVWEASFHYLQGFLFILLIMSLAQLYHYRQSPRYAVAAFILFTCSAFSLEVFYLTPWFVLVLGLYYRLALGYDRVILRKLVRNFVLPQLAIFAGQLILLRAKYGNHFAHIAENVVQPLASYLCKPPKYVFHVLFFGRYFPDDVRRKVYDICESVGGMVVFYISVVGLLVYLLANFRRLQPRTKAATFQFVCMIISVVILMPLAFPNIMLMFYDRYTYLLCGFTYMGMALLAGGLRGRYTWLAVLVLYGGICLYFTTKVNLYWKHSTYVDNRLLHELPDPGDKTVILLNIPENMHGIAMIGAQPEDQYKAMRELFVDSSIKNKVWDAASYNMNTKDDGAHVMVMNDSTIGVTLNQWGTWWWYEGHGGRSYETPDYKLNMRDVGHYYEITLKRPANNFMLLYSVGALWKKVDLEKRGVEQY